jgi:CheY-like chemotaxis protein
VTQVSLEGGQERSKHSILVVEDELLLRLDLSNQLRMAGFDVIEADTGDEALRVLANEIDVELVLTDIRMPGNTDGMGLAKWIRRQAPHIKVAILSAYIDPYWDMPVDATFAKPVRIERLLTGLRQLLPPMEQAGSGSH